MSQHQHQTCLIQPLSSKGPPVVVHTNPIPEITTPHEVLLRVSAVALNPTDYKIPEFHPAPGAIMGCDFMGTVIAAGSAVEECRGIGTRLCGSVQGSNPDNRACGGFAQYVVADSRLLVKIPDSWSDLEGAALGGIGWATVALAVEDSLGLGGRPSQPEPCRPDGNRVPVLVYGGATATGTIACQILARSERLPLNWFHTGHSVADRSVSYHRLVQCRVRANCHGIQHLCTSGEETGGLCDNPICLCRLRRDDPQSHWGSSQTRHRLYRQP